MFCLCVFADGILVVSVIDDLGIYSGDCLCHLCNRQIDRSPPHKEKNTQQQQQQQHMKALHENHGSNCEKNSNWRWRCCSSSSRVCNNKFVRNSRYLEMEICWLTAWLTPDLNKEKINENTMKTQRQSRGAL